MEENKYLNEEKYQATAKKIKKIGKTVLLVIGIVCTIIGFVTFSTTGINTVTSFTDDVPDFSGLGSGVGLGFVLFLIGMFGDGIGSTLTMIGGVMLFIGYKREIQAFTTQQAMPVVKETVNDVTPTVSKAAGSVAKEISKGIMEAREELKENKKEDE